MFPWFFLRLVPVTNKLVQAASGSTIHARVLHRDEITCISKQEFLFGHIKLSSATYFAHETGFAVVKDYELKGLIKEAVATIAVPACTGTFVASDRLRIIQADNKGRRFNLVENSLVLRASFQKCLTVLEILWNMSIILFP